MRMTCLPANRLEIQGLVTHIHAQDEALYVIKEKCTFNGEGNQGIPGTPSTFVSILGNTEHRMSLRLAVAVVFFLTLR